MKSLLFIMFVAFWHVANAQAIDTSGHKERSIMADSVKKSMVFSSSRYALNLADFNKSKSLSNPYFTLPKVQLYSDPVYLRRNAFPANATTAETLFGAAAKITAQVLVPNARFQ